MTRADGTANTVAPETWVDLFLDRTGTRPEAVYSADGERVLTYGALREQVDLLATALLGRGVRPGQVVAVWMTNSLDFLVAQWAVYRAGCALLPLYSYYREVELAHALAESRAPVLLTSRDFAGKTDPLRILRALLPELDAGGAPFAACPDLRAVVTVEDTGLPGATPMTELVAGVEPELTGLERIRGRLASTDLMNVMYTSGTTGVPKAGLSMHSNNLATVRHWSELARLGPGDVILAHVPMFTNFGCLYTNALALFNGCRLEVTRTFDAGRGLAAIGDRRVTYVPGSPEMFRMLLSHKDFPRTDTSSVRTAHVAGSAVDPALMRRIVDELAPNAMQAYGMSECGGLSTVTSDRDPLERRIDSVGRALPSALVRVVDPETGRDQPTGTVGEIWFGDAEPGSCVGKGYLAAPEATAAAITPAGWFRSGDLGRLDEDGYLYFTGRRKNMITVGGFNVYPAEVERHVLACPGVRACFVVGVPDQRLGSVPVAFVVGAPDLTEDTVIAFMRERVSSQKQPRRVWPVTEDELPTTPSGKVRLTELTETAAARMRA
ncbi:class I adenylate-forming enzyme family protein [Amycolatopsis antarctica]|uniref:class I adenylate-forming enzyme family protein n=1 Tax=Amycolatopsis antarctica TaxID=1854586 RepID=UPI0013FE33A0|nr:class I adenylate-forming enzyme family protein [Amycolatopsis antarctica]